MELAVKNYHDQYNKALKYSKENWDHFQQILTEHPHHRWGGGEADHTLRGAAADVYEEHSGDTEGANHLRNGQHVVIHDGQVHQGRFTVQPMQQTLDAIRDHLINHYSGDGLYDHIGFHMPQVTSTGSGKATVTIDPEGYDPIFGTTTPPSHLRLLPAESEHPIDKVGNTVADHLVELGRVDMAGFPAPYLRDDATFQNLIGQLRKAPVEEVVLDHH